MGKVTKKTRAAINAVLADNPPFPKYVRITQVKGLEDGTSMYHVCAEAECHPLLVKISAKYEEYSISDDLRHMVPGYLNILNDTRTPEEREGGIRIPDNKFGFV